jgi:hypothetical protein
VIPVAIFGSRRYAGRIKGSPRVERLIRDISGHNLAAVTEFVASVRQFESE